jgi:predicted RNA binding protein YcfA (HicA-like mRNA interferase family)
LPKFPGVSYNRAIRAFRKKGFEVVKEGKHTSMSNGKAIIIIPRHSTINAITIGIIIRDAGLTNEEFKELL